MTGIQWSFLVFGIIHSLLILTWAGSSTNRFFMEIGFIAIFAVLHLLSVLVPIMIGEKILNEDNFRLNIEIKKRQDEINKANLKLWENNKMAMVGQMAGNIAHEINNPLSIILLQNDITKRDVLHGSLLQGKIVSACTKISETVLRIKKSPIH